MMFYSSNGDYTACINLIDYIDSVYDLPWLYGGLLCLFKRELCWADYSSHSSFLLCKKSRILEAIQPTPTQSHIHIIHLNVLHSVYTDWSIIRPVILVFRNSTSWHERIVISSIFSRSFSPRHSIKIGSLHLYIIEESWEAMNNVWEEYGEDTTSEAWQDRVDTNANSESAKWVWPNIVLELLFAVISPKLYFSLIGFKSNSSHSRGLEQLKTARTPF